MLSAVRRCSVTFHHQRRKRCRRRVAGNTADSATFLAGDIGGVTTVTFFVLEG